MKKMNFKIQKTIIYKYLDLINQEFSTEAQITELCVTIEELYKRQVLSSSDIYRQKLEIILSNLKANIEILNRKRTNKRLKLELNKDLFQIFTNDIKDIDFTQSNLTDLTKLENEKEISITPENVKLVLENLVVQKRRLATEKDFEKFITTQLAFIFGKEQIHRQYSIGGFLALKTDIDIGNGKIGIELKIADHLNAADMQRMIGQVIYYKKRFYNSNLLVFVASKSAISSSIKELKDFIEELGTTVIFTTAINL